MLDGSVTVVGSPLVIAARICSSSSSWRFSNSRTRAAASARKSGPHVSASNLAAVNSCAISSSAAAASGDVSCQFDNQFIHRKNSLDQAQRLGYFANVLFSLCWTNERRICSMPHVRSPRERFHDGGVFVRCRGFGQCFEPV